ncbi:MAG: L,D-transpeptidase family protein [Paracoccaceae bacterium]|nr:L,D-transpeptidase family protein [Paracoccaceae bacterium]MDE3238213.1 L,D-transpeptidase family protein [Paracoccaceae bacterium]
MSIARAALAVIFIGGLAACAPKFKTYTGPDVTQVQVYKAERKMYLLHGDTVLKQYRVSLGQDPVGPKHFYGDMKTPEGQYTIDRRYPSKDFYLALGISYPNAEDVAYAKSQGKDPGGDIFIHGQEGWFTNRKDWTAGCIALSDSAMRDVYAMVQKGTPIFIEP